LGCSKNTQPSQDLRCRFAYDSTTNRSYCQVGNSNAASGEGARIRKGLKTPQEAYQAPILQALVELDGRSNLNPVLDRVYALMKGRLNEYDLTPLASDGVTPRWRNTAQWARNSLREEGLIRDDTPRSIWEITDEGRRRLRNG
jgi:restriction system protein